MNAIEFAARLDGRQIGNEITAEEDELARKNGLVVIFGYSDDLIELRGAFRDEQGAWNGTTLYLHRAGLHGIVPSSECPRCYQRTRKEAELCRTVRCHYEWREPGAEGRKWPWFIESHGSGTPGTFTILEGTDLFCRGLVLAVEDLPVVAPELPSVLPR